MFIRFKYHFFVPARPGHYLGMTVIWIALIFFLPTSSLIAAQNLKDLIKNQPDNRPWSINADTMAFDRQASLYMGSGNVVIARGDTRLTAEKVAFDPNNMIAKAQGAVTLTTGKDQLTCERIELDLNAETGIIHQGTVFLSEGHFYIRGNKIKKTGPESYSAEKANITTCDGDKPDWQVTARKLNITIEGYGTATHATMWARSIPMLYSPWLAFPVKIKRQTGLLAPHLGFSSSRKGLSWDQPFFWAVNDQSDMTFNYNYMEKRGHQYGLEYRYILSPKARGMLMFDWLDDAKTDDGVGDDSDWSYEDDGREYLRPNSERYWFRMKHDQPLGAGYTAKLDLDVVSDQDYLPEFKHTLTGFKASQQAFENFFGRGIEDYTDITRVNRANVSRTWTHYNLNAGVLWTDHVINRNLDRDDSSVQHLPIINFDGSKHRLHNTPFRWALNSQYTYLYRQVNPSSAPVTASHRWDAHPRVFLPFNWGNYLNIEPSVGIRETAWYPTSANPPHAGEDEFFNRQLWDARLSLSNGFFRIFKSQIGAIDRIKHDIKPKISYSYLPRVDQDDYPHFNSVDRIPSENLITYSITNVWTYRKQVLRVSKNDTDDSFERSPVYHQFARLHFQQSYDLSDGKDPYNNLQYNEDGANTEVYRGDYPFSAIYAEFEFTPQNYFSLDADADWSVYDGQFKTGNMALNLWDRRKDQLKLEYRFAERTSLSKADDNTEESFLTSASIKLTERLNLFGSWERDLYTDTELLYGGGFVYSSQCWSLEASHTVEGRDHRYSFIIDLYGLGKIGN